MIELVEIEDDICTLDRGLWILFDQYNLHEYSGEAQKLLKWFPIFFSFGASVVSFKEKNRNVSYKVLLSESNEDIFFMKLRDYLDDFFLYCV